MPSTRRRKHHRHRNGWPGCELSELSWLELKPKGNNKPPLWSQILKAPLEKGDS